MRPGAFVVRASNHLGWRARRVANATADRLRRGDRTVIMTPPIGLRFGNWLYLWLDAHSRAATNHPTFVRSTDAMAPWLDAFPGLRSLTIPTREIRFHDRREWGERSWHQRFDVDFDRAELRSFIDGVLAPRVKRDDSGTLVVNVRRGDYYSQPHLRERYGFDQIHYLRLALDIIGTADNALVVSDDPVWCEANLPPVLGDHVQRVDYASADPVSNFLSVAGASRIIGMNSTFTYWAAHVADVLHGGAQVVMPRFHGRFEGGNEAYQLDPHWHAIEGLEASLPDNAAGLS